MCGIAGFVGTGGREDLRAMNIAQAHRGPDADGQWIDPEFPVFLGHRRLSILDIAGGAQPMWTADGALGIVFNGEIYNFADLRQELVGLGAQFHTDHSDTEVILEAYRHWGDECVSRFNGMWAFVIYDRGRRRLFASRDRFGKKPFYYVHRKELFAFASELTALMQHRGVEARLSVPALRKFFAYGYIPAPGSLLEGARKLPGGHNLEYTLADGRLRVWKYWDFTLEPDTDLPDDAEARWCEELRERLARAVERRLVSDVPIGAFLSGGIDSSAVAAFAAKRLGRGRLNTYSIGFEEPSFDESRWAERAASLVGSNHHLEVLSIDRARRWLPEVLSRLDEPLGDSSLLPTWLLCGFARRHVTVAIGGDGADELFAGYDPFRALRWAQMYEAVVPRPVHRAVSMVAARMPVSHRNMSLDFRIKRTLRGLDYPQSLWCPVWMAPIGPDELAECFGGKIDLDEVYSEAIEAWESCRVQDPVDRTLQFYTTLYLQDDILTKVDRASMMHSLEVRAPFLDIEVVDLVRRIPSRYKLRGGQTKYLLKKALEPVLPADILYRSKKGFGVPIGAWFRSGSVAAPPGPLPGVDPAFLARKISAHLSGRSDERAFLWNALSYATFAERFANPAAAAA